MKSFKILYNSICFVLLLACNHDEMTITSPMLDFVKSKEYSYYESKEKIPQFILDSLTRINNEQFLIGDTSELMQIDLSDARIVKDSDRKFKRRLHFLLLSENACLLSYVEGGIGTHDVVDFFHINEEVKHTRITTTVSLSDTTKLLSYLKFQGEAESQQFSN